MQSGYETGTETDHSTSAWRRVGRLVARLHRDEGGAEMVEKLLIIAAISLPLLGVLYFFVNNWLVPWLQEEADEMRGRDMDSPW